DVYSRRIVGWKAARSMTTALVLDALNMAAWTRRHSPLDGLVCHNDAGAADFRNSPLSITEIPQVSRGWVGLM
ncbi:MAG TPA: hypothetical protein VMV14_11515, partial [Acidimicrobiales bacterium]|nr:hypothetical protein [Acidimicrobiales bacterium]